MDLSIDAYGFALVAVLGVFGLGGVLLGGLLVRVGVQPLPAGAVGAAIIYYVVNLGALQILGGSSTAVMNRDK